MQFQDIMLKNLINIIIALTLAFVGGYLLTFRYYYPTIKCGPPGALIGCVFPVNVWILVSALLFAILFIVLRIVLNRFWK